MNYATLESLAPVAGLLNRAGTCLATLPVSPWRMIAGRILGPLSLPIMAWDVTKFVYDKIEENKRLSEAKLELYKEAVKKQNAIIKALQDEKKLDDKRIAEMKEIIIELTRTIRELKEDLDSAA